MPEQDAAEVYELHRDGEVVAQGFSSFYELLGWHQRHHPMSLSWAIANDGFKVIVNGRELGADGTIVLRDEDCSEPDGNVHEELDDDTSGTRHALALEMVGECPWCGEIRNEINFPYEVRDE